MSMATPALSFPPRLRHLIEELDQASISNTKLPKEIRNLLQIESVRKDFFTWARQHPSIMERSPLLSRISSHIATNYQENIHPNKLSKIARLTDWLYKKIKSLFRYLFSCSIETWMDQSGESRKFKLWMCSGNRLPLILDYLSSGLLRLSPEKLTELTLIVFKFYQNCTPGFMDYWRALEPKDKEQIFFIEMPRSDILNRMHQREKLHTGFFHYEHPLFSEMIQTIDPARRVELIVNIVHFSHNRSDALSTILKKETLTKDTITKILTFSKETRPLPLAFDEYIAPSVIREILNTLTGEELVKILTRKDAKGTPFLFYSNCFNLFYPFLENLEGEHLIQVLSCTDLNKKTTLFSWSTFVNKLQPLLAKINNISLIETLRQQNQSRENAYCYNDYYHTFSTLIAGLRGESLVQALTDHQDKDGFSPIWYRTYQEALYPLIADLRGEHLVRILTCKNRLGTPLVCIDEYLTRFYPLIEKLEGEHLVRVLTCKNRLGTPLVCIDEYLTRFYPLIEKLEGEHLIQILTCKNRLGNSIIVKGKYDDRLSLMVAKLEGAHLVQFLNCTDGAGFPFTYYANPRFSHSLNLMSKLRSADLVEVLTCRDALNHCLLDFNTDDFVKILPLIQTLRGKDLATLLLRHGKAKPPNEIEVETWIRTIAAHTIGNVYWDADRGVWCSGTIKCAATSAREYLAQYYEQSKKNQAAIITWLATLDAKSLLALEYEARAKGQDLSNQNPAMHRFFQKKHRELIAEMIREMQSLIRLR